ncbi:TetR/AcrR family transcriptional regulator [Sulfurimonas sp.]
MARIVDKIQKKKDIALACKDLILQKGLHNLTVAQMAKEANIGKGTTYEYFRSKEEIVFELALILMQEHRKVLEAAITKQTTTRQKLKEFSSFFYTQQHKELREIYKQFIALSLLHPKTEMLEFNATSIQGYFDWFKEILQEGVNNGELRPEILQLSSGMFALGDGLFIQSAVTNTLDDLQQKTEAYIDTLFDIMEIAQ